jgi:LPS-assembly lipoprotein
MLLLSACGWHLKGTQSSNHQLGSIYVTGDVFNSLVTKTVRADLRNSGIEVPDKRSDADYVLWIGAEQSNLRAASYDVLVRAVENTLMMQASYNISNAQGESLTGPMTVYAERVYEYDVQGVTSSAAQLSIISRELQERLAQQIVRRVAAVESDTDPEEPVDSGSHTP